MSEHQGSPASRLLLRAAHAPVAVWRFTRRIAGYVLASSDDSRAVYGDDPNGLRDESNVSGNVAANAIGGIGH